MNVQRRCAPIPVRPNGTVAATFAVALPVMLGFMGLAIDVSMLYLRNTEMQQLADATAVAAAHRLDGTLAGVTAARNAATAIAAMMSYGGPYQDASSRPMFSADAGAWSTAAIFLSKSLAQPDWIAADAVADDAGAAGLLYVKVDTGVLAGLSAKPGLVSTTLLRILDGAAQSATAAPVAVAGRVQAKVTPLGVCALNTTRFAPRQAEPLPPAAPIAPELMEFGFRRGITYNLLGINPKDANGPYVVDPIDAPAGPVHASSYTAARLKPFFCGGMVAFGDLYPGASVHVARLADLGAVDIAAWLNSRLDINSGDRCAAREGAPPDTNVREYVPQPVSAPKYSWMPGWQTNALAAVGTVDRLGAHVTLADVTVAGSSPTYTDPVTAPGFGPLWIYSKPVKYVAGSATGAAASPQVFATSDWPSLYQTTAPPAVTAPGTSYPSAMPWRALTTSPTAGYKHPGRRVLALPLLDCSAAVGASAQVLGVGNFYMTSRAVSGVAVYGEFAGLASAASLTASVVRLQ